MSEQFELGNQATEAQDSAPDAGNVEANNASEAPLTRADVEKLVKDLTAKQYQAIQSMSAKQANHIKEEFEKRIAAMTEAGLKFTPEEAAKIQEATRKQLTETQPDNGKQAAQSAPQASDQGQQLINAYVEAMFDVYGVKVNPDDPEAAEVDLSSPENFKKTYRQVVEKAAQKANTPAQARMPAPAGSGPSSPSAEKYKQEMWAAKGRPAEMRQIKEKFRKSGLDVDSIPLYR